MASPSSATTPLVARTRNDAGSSSHAMAPGFTVTTSPRSERTCIALRALMWRSTLRISIHRVPPPSVLVRAACTASRDAARTGVVGLALTAKPTTQQSRIVNGCRMGPPPPARLGAVRFTHRDAQGAPHEHGNNDMRHTVYTDRGDVRAMRPDDANGRRAPEERPFRVLLIAGSNRRQYDCPGIDSKARTLMFRMSDRLPQEWEIDLEDLGNVWNREQIRSCNGCVSTSAALCVWPCNCYEKGSWFQADLMWDLDLYARLDLADAWAIIGPVNWYGPTSNLKAMFDRLVCMNGGNPREDLIGHKDPALAIQLEHSPEFEALKQNHLEGRTAGFFSYGDGGGDELDDSGVPKILRHREWFDSSSEPFDDMRDTYAPLVWQCRYSGIEVPDALWRYVEFGRDKKYSENQAEHMVDD